MVEDWLKTVETEISNPNRQVHYISIEYLMGRTLSNALISTGLYDQVKQALGEMWIDLDELCEMEADPGLGNEGLGRLAACFMDSLSTLGYPAWGYGLRYDYGMFKQCIIDNKQVEKTDDWLKYGFSWEFFRDKAKHVVQFGGYVIQEGEIGKWVSDGKVMAVAYDQIIPGYNTDTTNTLRLWSAHAYDGLDMAKFNQGDYANALGKKPWLKISRRSYIPMIVLNMGKSFVFCRNIYWFQLRFRISFTVTIWFIKRLITWLIKLPST